MRGGAITLGDLAGKVTTLEIACRRCDRRGRLSVARLIEQHGDMRLPELCHALAAIAQRGRRSRSASDAALLRAAAHLGIGQHRSPFPSCDLLRRRRWSMRLLRTAAGTFVNAAAIVRLKRDDDGAGWLAVLADGGEELLVPYYSTPGRIERDFPHLVPRAPDAAAVPTTLACQAEACCAG